MSVDELQAAADEEDAAYQKSLEEYRAKVEAAQKENAEVIDENHRALEQRLINQSAFLRV